MKKSFSSFLLTIMLFSGTFMVSPLATYAKNDVSPGSIIKGEHAATLYYVGEDGKRYVYPNANTFFSWHDDFTSVVEVSDEDLQDLPLGGNVRYKPGALLVKIQSDPKVYAVGENGKLRWVKSEALAKALYGKNWNKLIDDVPDSFFVNYETGDDIEDDEDFDPIEEDEQVTSESENLGLKQRAEAKLRDKSQKTCLLLEKNLNRLQERLTRLGVEIPDVADELLEKCFDFVGSNDSDTGKKITLCHKEDETLSVGAPAARAHFAHGDTVGNCAGNEDDENDDDGDDVIIDVTAPVISDVTTTVSATSTLVTWTTDETASSLTTYATSTLETATETTDVEDLTLTTSHSLNLTELLASTEYFFKVSSTDEAGNTGESTESSFTTSATSTL